MLARMSAADRLAILEAIGRYSYAIDGRDAGAYAALFAERGVFETTIGAGPRPHIRVEGRGAIRAWAAETMARWGEARTRHHQCGAAFDALDADAARTRTLLLETRMAPGDRAPRPWTQGVYTDDWTRGPSGWRLARRALRLDAPPRA